MSAYEQPSLLPEVVWRNLGVDGRWSAPFPDPDSCRVMALFGVLYQRVAVPFALVEMTQEDA